MNKAPVLLITFNRPDTTELVFEKIKKAKPPKLYIFSDGPRPDVPDDNENIGKTREIINQIDWECECRTKFEKENLGCGPGPASAMSWVFEQEDRAIILEDDCIPSESFFPYCNELLERYKDDERIWKISGNNFYEEVEMPYSYIFSNYGHSWGWATWRRCWLSFDLEMKNLKDFYNIGGFYNILNSKRERKYFTDHYKKYLNINKYINHIWDSQYDFTVKSNMGLSIIPAKNLVKNIGLQGTHSSTGSKYHNRNIDDSFRIIKHPQFIIPYQKYDDYSFIKHYYNDKRYYVRIQRKFRKIINKIFR